VEDPGVAGRIILKWILKTRGGGGCMDWIDLNWNGDRWQAVVN